MNAIQKKGLWLITPALLGLFTFIVYYPSLRYGFVFDDFPTIIEYIHARKLDVSGLFFKIDRWVSRLLNQYTFVNWGKNPFAYRIFDVLLHIIIGVMIFVFVAFLFKKTRKHAFLQEHAYLLATLVAGLFLLHPAQTQTVSNITQMRLEGLVVFFTFAVLLCFIFAVRAKSSVLQHILYGFAFIFAAFGSGSKEIIVTLPFLVVFVDWFFIAEGDWADFKTRLWAHGCIFGVVFGLLYKYGVVRPQAIAAVIETPIHNNRGNVITTKPSEFITAWVFFFSQFKIIMHYIVMFFVPVGLSFDYGYKLSPSFFSYDVIAPLCMLLALGGGMLYLFVKDRAHAIVFCFAWFFCAILPRASFFPGMELACDYKSYVASFGIFLCIALALMYLLRQVKRAHLFLMLPLFFIALGLAAGQRNRVWRSEEALWKDVLDKNPKIARAWNNYAVALSDRGDREGAIKMFEKAIEVDNWYAEPHINIATLLRLKQGNRDQVYARYVRALEIGEAHPELFNDLGTFYHEGKFFEQAEACFKEALRLRGYFSLAWRNLGNLYYSLQKYDQALGCYENAIHGDFVEDEMVYMYGLTAYLLGKYDQALESFEPLAQKNYKEAAFYTGGIYFGKHKYEQACRYFEVMYKQHPENVSCIYNYALTLLNLNRPAEARPLFFECMKHPYENQYSVLHYGRCLFELGMKDEAKKVLTDVLKSTVPDFVKRDTIAYMKEVKLS